MKYTEEMILHSESGYCMPFEEPQGKEVEMTLGYGEQTDPGTGKPFFHHGIDFNARYYRLSAVASGIVSGVGNDPVHGICQTIRYGEYEVTYGHLSNVFAQFGQRVKAGQTVALSGDRLHVEAVNYSGIIDPLAELDIDIQSFDIPRIVSVYPDRAGVRWWTKAWFNNREEGEASVEIEREQAIRFIHDNIEKDAWLEEFFPKQMEVYHNAIEQTKEQLLKQINMI